MPTIEDLLRRGREQLSGDTQGALMQAQILLGHVLRLTRSQLAAHPRREARPEQAAAYMNLIERRRAGEPIAYLTETREFWSLTLRVSPATLIPRPETERLVELALERIPKHAPWRIADLGTGSGAVALAIASERPLAHVVATDLSSDALAVARDNAARLDVRNVEFRLGDWCEPLGSERYQVIVSNPPYIAAGDPHLTEGDLRYEPPLALSCGPDGLAALRRIAEMARQQLHPGGWLLLEHGYDQQPAVIETLTRLGYQSVHGHRDLAGIPRVCCGII